MDRFPELQSLEQAQRIDQLCDQFEAAWKAGQLPRLEQFLLDHARAAERALALRSLLAVELELSRREGRPAQEHDYAARFPQFAGVVREAFQELNTRAETQAALDTSVAQATNARQTSLPPRFDHFEVLEVLGQGGFGTVYRARDTRLERDVAIKAPRPDQQFEAEDLRRFQREARALAALQHPNICSVHDAGQFEGRPYLVMALVQGEPLSSLLKRRPQMDEPEILAIVRPLALALAEAHRQKIVHRDLKPSNIVIDAKRGQPVLMDFGLARRLGLDESRITFDGQLVGTPAYMSPEQAAGQHELVGPAADIYSLGVILYELLCGERPFRGSATEVVAQILRAPCVPPSKIRSTISPRLEAICLKAMSRTISDRFASMEQFVAALDDREYGRSAASLARSTSPERGIDPYEKWLKIPPGKRPPTHYELLGLPAFESSAERIRHAAMERLGLVKKYQLGEHEETAKRLMTELSVAFDCLSRADLKQAYDDALRKPESSAVREMPAPLQNPASVAIETPPAPPVRQPIALSAPSQPRLAPRPLTPVPVPLPVEASPMEAPPVVAPATYATQLTRAVRRRRQPRFPVAIGLIAGVAIVGGIVIYIRTNKPVEIKSQNGVVKVMAEDPQAEVRTESTPALAAPAPTLPTSPPAPVSGIPRAMTNSIGMKLILVPAGAFQMGDAAGDANERPVRQVTISKAFYIGTFEVTQKEYGSVMGVNPSVFKAPDRPVGS
jgi:serine/threonine protein kinase